MKKVGIFGSALGPPTYGHEKLILESLNYFDEVWIVPSFIHGFGKEMFPYDFRCKLTGQFVQDLNNPKVYSYPVEHLTEKGLKKQSVYTWDLLTYIQNQINKSSANIEIGFIMGPDNLEAWPKFYRSKDISRNWHVFVGAETKGIRSTIVRKAIANNQSISEYVTPGVESLMSNAPEDILDLIRRQAGK